jgi:hypothetical protein
MVPMEPSSPAWRSRCPKAQLRRNPIVHSSDEWESPKPIPDGTLSTVKRENYNTAEATRAVTIMLGVLTYCAAHPGTDPLTVKWADPNRKAAIDGLDQWWRTQGWHPFDGEDDTEDAPTPVLSDGRWRSPWRRFHRRLRLDRRG